MNRETKVRLLPRLLMKKGVRQRRYGKLQLNMLKSVDLKDMQKTVIQLWGYHIAKFIANERNLKTILASLCSSSRFDLAANQKISWPFLVKRFSSPSAMASPRRKDRFFFHSLTYKQLSSTNTVSGVAENF